jgi:hypothetical protein
MGSIIESTCGCKCLAKGLNTEETDSTSDRQRHFGLVLCRLDVSSSSGHPRGDVLSAGRSLADFRTPPLISPGNVVPNL